MKQAASYFSVGTYQKVWLYYIMDVKRTSKKHL